ncbi:hypothetical protein BJX66DRAFT_3402 [Aspergillus keveii]|jgi:mitochondrial fission protein ELM1|uniref:Uncharacterized protein n=1 Tax=Aspergillus keveii TaxID=714993 RepID=A0ABR4GQ77_9EURO
MAFFTYSASFINILLATHPHNGQKTILQTSLSRSIPGVPQLANSCGVTSAGTAAGLVSASEQLIWVSPPTLGCPLSPISTAEH